MMSSVHKKSFPAFLLLISLLIVSSCSINDDRNNFIDPFVPTKDSTMEPSSIWNGSVDLSFFNQSNTILYIESGEQLAGLAHLVNQGENFSGFRIELLNDIYLNNTEDFDAWTYNNSELNVWIPIGNMESDNNFEKSFCGTFDGNNFSIFGMFINDSLLTNHPDFLCAGLFGSISNTNKSLNFVNLTSIKIEKSLITVNHSNLYFKYVGSVVGKSYGGGGYGKINGLINIISDTVIYAPSHNYIAGIVGSSGTNIINSAFLGSIFTESSNKYICGIACANTFPMFIVNSFTSSDIGLSAKNNYADNGILTDFGITYNCYFIREDSINFHLFGTSRIRSIENNLLFFSRGNGVFDKISLEVSISPLEKGKKHNDIYYAADNYVDDELNLLQYTVDLTDLLNAFIAKCSFLNTSFLRNWTKDSIEHSIYPTLNEYETQ